MARKTAKRYIPDSPTVFSPRLLWARVSAKAWTLWGNNVKCAGEFDLGAGREVPGSIDGSCAGLTRAIHLLRKKVVTNLDGLPGHKRVYARLRRAMPGNDGDRSGARSPSSHRGDRFDLQQEIGVGEAAQDAQRAGRRRAGEIGLQDATRLGHVVRVANEDRDL